MRILNIAFRNLNSLAGDWSIDLRAPEFEASGIFAITGPTGAGKSTVLDAVCLALYGSTPRLGKVSKGANDIMTRGTGDCFADVTFSTLRGEFRCRWSQRRARGKADGELQPARHELFDAEGVSLADKMHDVAARVEELTGMDFERFTQSALLAQGRFATFLLAEGRDRAPLLEQLTGTEIYSRISSHIFRRAKAEQERLAALDAELASCNILSDDEEKALRDDCLRIAGEAADIDAQEKALNVQLNSLRSCSALKKEQEALGAEVLLQVSDGADQADRGKPRGGSGIPQAPAKPAEISDTGAVCSAPERCLRPQRKAGLRDPDDLPQLRHPAQRAGGAEHQRHLRRPAPGGRQGQQGAFRLFRHPLPKSH